MHNLIVDTEFSQVHDGRMELAALAMIADQLDALAEIDCLPHRIDPGLPALAWLARVALDGREPTEEQKQALGTAIDVALYLEELDA